jgi:hypothetical protein
MVNIAVLRRLAIIFVGLVLNIAFASTAHPAGWPTPPCPPTDTPQTYRSIGTERFSQESVRWDWTAQAIERRTKDVFRSEHFGEWALRSEPSDRMHAER